MIGSPVAACDLLAGATVPLLGLLCGLLTLLLLAAVVTGFALLRRSGGAAHAAAAPSGQGDPFAVAGGLTEVWRLDRQLRLAEQAARPVNGRRDTIPCHTGVGGAAALRQAPDA